MYDITVIGGGPAGASCAEILAKKGFSCLLVEKNNRNRYKVCAGGITSDAVRLKDIPPSIVERKITHIHIFSVSQSIKIEMKDTGYTVYRTAYDQWLRDCAEQRGVSINYQDRIKKVNLKKGIVKGATEYKSRVIVGAFGSCPVLHRQFGVVIPGFVQALQRELFLPEDEVSEKIGNTLHVYFNTQYASWGYSWIFPKREGVSVGLLLQPETAEKMDRMTSFIHHQQSLQNATPRKFGRTHTFGGYILKRPVDKTYGKNFVLVGDAAGMCDPLTYEGVSNALRSGRIAADAIAEYLEYDSPLESYQKKWKEALFQDDISYAIKLQNLLYGHSLSDQLTEAVVELANEDPVVKRGFEFLFNKREPRKALYNILINRKLAMMRKVGLSSLELLPRLIMS